MNWLIKGLSSSVGKKFVMGISGLLLCGFLVVHLAGNLLLFVGAKAYNDYAHKLHSQEGLLMIAETGLFALFIAHIVLAVVTARENRAARLIEYERKETKQSKQLASISPETFMFVSGAVVFAFLLLHLSDFKMELRPDITYEGLEPYDKAVTVLNTRLSFWVYLGGCIVLGIHLSHGFSSAFQSLGLNHPKYNACIKWFGILFAIVIAVGFALFPLWAATGTS